jgi:hypothetical protein
MKTVIISLSLLILLLACGKTPEDPGRPGKNPVPRTGAVSAPTGIPSTEGEAAGLFGSVPVPAPAPRNPTRWM